MTHNKTKDEQEINELLKFNDKDLGIDTPKEEYNNLKNWIMGSNHRCRLLLYFLKYKRGTIPDVAKNMINGAEITNLSEHSVNLYVKGFANRKVLIEGGRKGKAIIWVINLNNKLIYDNQKDLIISCMNKLGIKNQLGMK